ncbi:hypothetical protein QBC47DRAFT_80587 [Echria macrotheca]|uniref:Uncharacterized protein n=1 Tax=Echria macrotheca TaxID=438768 RepID=A0AAJ0B6G5_9PEZI|nr:hypothetical protein QBC47DRAFT_80587 [Echria macrotheca]
MAGEDAVQDDMTEHPLACVLKREVTNLFSKREQEQHIQREAGLQLLQNAKLELLDKNRALELEMRQRDLEIRQLQQKQLEAGQALAANRDALAANEDEQKRMRTDDGDTADKLKLRRNQLLKVLDTIDPSNLEALAAVFQTSSVAATINAAQPSQISRESESELGQDERHRRSSRAKRPTEKAQHPTTTESDTNNAMHIDDDPPDEVSTCRRTSRRRDTRDSDHEERAVRKRPRLDQRTISFDEVYGNGKPRYRHMIVEHPRDSRGWYIIRCDMCGIHFNNKPIQGGGKHIDGVQHGHQSRTATNVVAHLGFYVLGCDAEKARLNNDAFIKALREGYVPLSQQTTSKHERISSTGDPGGEEDAGDQQKTARPSSTAAASAAQAHHGVKGKPFEGITDPKVGNIYRAYYRGTRHTYPALLLPLGSFGSVGVAGDIHKMDHDSKAPKCYRRTTGGRILGWADGYADGGARVRDRSFPVMWLDRPMITLGRLVIPPSLGWVKAKDLRPFDTDDEECQNMRGHANVLELFRLVREWGGEVRMGQNCGVAMARGASR